MQASGGDKVVGAKDNQPERNDSRRWHWQPVDRLKACEHWTVDREARGDHKAFMDIRPPSKIHTCHHETRET
jgi:hypothetical protein